VLNGVPVFVYKSNSPMIFVFDYKYYILWNFISICI
jgi:hypothetical protein